MFFAASTFFIIARVQSERTGELRRFAQEGQYPTNTPRPVVNTTTTPRPSITLRPTVTPKPDPCRNLSGTALSFCRNANPLPTVSKTPTPIRTPTPKVYTSMTLGECNGRHGTYNSVTKTCTVKVTPIPTVKVAAVPTNTVVYVLDKSTGGCSPKLGSSVKSTDETYKSSALCITSSWNQGLAQGTAASPRVTPTVPPRLAAGQTTGVVTAPPGVGVGAGVGIQIPIVVTANIVSWFQNTFGGGATTPTPTITPKPTIAPNEKCFPNCGKQCQYGSTGVFGAAKCNPKPTDTPKPVASGATPVTPKPTLKPGEDCVLIGGGDKNCKDFCPGGEYIVWGGKCKPAPTDTPKPVTPANTTVTKAPQATVTTAPVALVVQPTVTPIVPTVTIKPATTVTPGPTEKPKPKVNCGGILEGNVATGEQYGETTEMNDNQRWRCIVNPKNPNEGMWEQCPGCPLTIISSTARLKDEYEKESAAFTEKIDKMAADIYACGTSASCKSQVYSTYGLTGESMAYQQIAKDQVASQVKVYESQDIYFENREKWDLCKAQQANDKNCDGYMQQANNALIAAGLDPVAAAAQLADSYHDYVVNKASNLYLIAESDYASCVESKKTQASLDCSALQKNAIAALTYPGTTPADQAEITKLYTSYKKASEYVYQSNQEICGTCSPAQANALRQQHLSRSGLSEGYQENMLEGWQTQIVNLVKGNGPGSEMLICKEVIGTSACDSLESARAALKSAVSGPMQSQLTASFALNDTAILNVTGSDAEVIKWAEEHKNDPRLAGVAIGNAAAVRAALDSSLPDNLKRENLLPEEASIAEANPDSAYAAALEKYKQEQIAAGDRAERVKTPEQWAEEFDAYQQEIWEKMKPIYAAQGKDALIEAKIAQGLLVPSEIHEQYFEKYPQWVYDMQPGWENFWNSVKKPFVSENSEIAKFQAQGQVEQLSLNSTSQQSVFTEVSASDAYKSWLKTAKIDPSTPPEEQFVQHQLELYYGNKAYLDIAKGHYEPGTDSEKIFFQRVITGDVDMAKLDQDLSNPLAKPMLLALNFGQKAAPIVTFGLIDNLTPNLTNMQSAVTAENTITYLEKVDPEVIQTRVSQIKTDKDESAAYLEWKKAQPADKDTSEKAYIIDLYAQAVATTANAKLGEYELDGAAEFFATNPDWLTRSVLNGTDGLDTFYDALADSKAAQDQAYKNFLLDNSPERAETYEQNLEKIKEEQAEIFTQAFTNSLTQDQIDALAIKLDEKGITQDADDYVHEQVKAYLESPEIREFIGSGGIESSIDLVVSGDFNAVAAQNAYNNLSDGDKFLVSLNSFTDGKKLESVIEQGQIKKDYEEGKISWGEYAGRTAWAEIKGDAKVVGTALAVAAPPIRAFQLGAAAFTVPSVLSITGEAMGFQMTGSSLADTAANCTFREDQNTGACLTSAGMTVFAAWSTASSINGLNQAARSSALNGTNWFSPRDAALVRVSQITKGTETITTQLVDDATTSVTKAFATKPPNVVMERARNLLGATVFGAQAAQNCSQTGINADCILTASLAGISLARTFMPTKAILNPTSQASQTVVRTDQVVNGMQAVAACGAAANGLAKWENCTTSLMMAGLSVGPDLARQSIEGTGSKFTNPFEAKTVALADLALIDGLKNYTNLDKITLSDGQVVTFNNQAAARAQVLNTLGAAVVESGRTVAQMRGIAAEVKADKSIPKNETERSYAQRELIRAADLMEKLIGPDGTINKTVEIDGVARPVTTDMIDSVRKSIEITQRQVALEHEITKSPRTAVQQLGDSIAKALNRQAEPIKDFEAAKKAFAEAAKSADTKPVEYEAARLALEAAKTKVEQMGYTRT